MNVHMSMQKIKWIFGKHPDLPHTLSDQEINMVLPILMRCYWEEQMWIRTKSISCQEFFHGMQKLL